MSQGRQRTAWHVQVGEGAGLGMAQHVRGKAEQSMYRKWGGVYEAESLGGGQGLAAHGTHRAGSLKARQSVSKKAESGMWSLERLGRVGGTERWAEHV